MSERPQVEWLDEDASIPGMFDFSQVYDWVVEVAPEGSTLVELGVFHGRSLIYLAKKAKKAGKGLKVVGVDWGLGIATGYCANAVLENLYIRKLEVPLIFADASVAAQFFPPESCFFVFIDADHEEGHVRSDILSWWPKVERGGYLAGHDYENPHYPFPGVKNAVDDIFGPGAGNQPIPGSWMVKKDGSREPGSR